MKVTIYKHTYIHTYVTHAHIGLHSFSLFPYHKLTVTVLVSRPTHRSTSLQQSVATLQKYDFISTKQFHTARPIRFCTI
jgi:hypothetical protein